MTAQNIGLLKAMTAKMGYLDTRQALISQNIANADTPGYIPQDLTPVDFSSVLKKVTTGGMGNISPETTHGSHMPTVEGIDDADTRKQRLVYEVAPAGNAVVMEEQMIKASQTAMDYSLMTTLYQKNIGMIKMALGVG